MYANGVHDRHIAVLSQQLDNYLERIVVLNQEIDMLKKQNERLMNQYLDHVVTSNEKISRLRDQLDSIEPLSNR